MINEDLLESARQEIFSYLCENEPLLRLYSKKEIRERIEKNIKEIRTNEVDYKRSGWCDMKTPVIALCDLTARSEPLTIQDINESESLTETLIHEGIHAVLKHETGTGIQHVLEKTRQSDSEECFYEIGRGLNEGYTNWVLEKCGIETTSYGLLTSLNMQLESCIGEDAMMQFSNGNIQEMSKKLNMSERQGIAFLRQIDDIYYIERIIGEISKTEKYIECKINNLQKGEEVTQEELNREERIRKDLEDTYTYGEIFTDKIINKLNSNNKKDFQISIYTKLLEKLRTNFKKPEETAIKLLVDDVETTIIQRLITDRMDSPQSIEDIEKMIDLMQEMKYAISCYDGKCYQFDVLREKIQKACNEQVNKVHKEIEKLIASGNFTAKALRSEYEKLYRLFGSTGEIKEKNLISSYAKFVSSKSKNKKENELLIRYFLNEDGPIPKNISVRMTKSQRGLIFENGKLIAILDEKDNPLFEGEDKILHKGESFQDKMDWTEDMDTDYDRIIRNFEWLRARKLAKNPNIEIQIDNKMIIFRDGEHYEFYDIVEGEDAGIRRAKFTTLSPVKFMLDDNNRKNNGLIPLLKENSFFMQYRNTLKKVKSIFKKKEKQEEQENTIMGLAEKQANFSASLAKGTTTNYTPKHERTVKKNIKEDQEK